MASGIQTATAETYLAKETIESHVGEETIIIAQGSSVEIVGLSEGQAFARVTTPSKRSAIIQIPAGKLEKVISDSASPEPAPTPTPPATVDGVVSPTMENTSSANAATAPLPIPDLKKSAITFVGKPMSLGSNNSFEVAWPMDEETRKICRKLGIEVPTTLIISLTVPHDFNPDKPQNVMTCYMSDSVPEPDTAAAGSFEFMTKKGWTVLAARGPQKAKGSYDRALNILAAIKVLETEWPGVKSWSFAAGGFSGGAKAAGYVAPVLLGDQRRVIGVFLSGCNQATPVMAASSMKTIRKYADKDYRRVPIVLSNGKSDDIAGVDKQKTVTEILDNNGFKCICSASFDDGHTLHGEHIDPALTWFAEHASKESCTRNGQQPPGMNEA